MTTLSIMNIPFQLLTQLSLAKAKIHVRHQKMSLKGYANYIDPYLIYSLSTFRSKLQYSDVVFQQML